MNLKSVLEKTYSSFQCVELAPFLYYSVKTLFTYSTSCSFIDQFCSNDTLLTTHVRIGYTFYIGYLFEECEREFGPD